MPEISPVSCAFARVRDLRAGGLLTGDALYTVIENMAESGATPYDRDTAAAMIAGNPIGNNDFAEWFDYVEPVEETVKLIITVVGPRDVLDGYAGSRSGEDLAGLFYGIGDAGIAEIVDSKLSEG